MKTVVKGYVMNIISLTRNVNFYTIVNNSGVTLIETKNFENF